MYDPIPRHRALIVWRKNYINSEKHKNIRTICEVLRELHQDAVKRGDALSMHKIELANFMALRMQDRLKRYALKSKEPQTLTVNDVDEMFWITKKAYRRAERKGNK
jgi:hypothetical protein